MLTWLINLVDKTTCRHTILSRRLLSGAADQSDSEEPSGQLMNPSAGSPTREDVTGPAELQGLQDYTYLDEIPPLGRKQGSHTPGLMDFSPCGKSEQRAGSALEHLLLETPEANLDSESGPELAPSQGIISEDFNCFYMEPPRYVAEREEMGGDAFPGSAQDAKIDDGGPSYRDAYQLGVEAGAEFPQAFLGLDDSPRVLDCIKTNQGTGSDGDPPSGTFKAVLVIEKCDHELVKYLIDIARPIQGKVKIEMTI